MSKDAEPPKSTPKDDEFDERHAQELGVKRFAKIQAIYTFLPLLAGAAGAALGAYVLAFPAAKLFPRLSKAAGIAEVAGGKLKDSIGMLLHKRPVAEVFQEFSPTGEQITKITEAWNNKAVTDKAGKFAEILNFKLPKVPKTFRLVNGVGGLFVGMTGGSIAVGYDQWRKAEAARLAAGEINRDIANLELFKPSDPELVAENKRLHAMVAALPTIDAASAQRQGMVEEKQQEASVH